VAKTTFRETKKKDKIKKYWRQNLPKDRTNRQDKNSL
jgi:hypothetical protein